MLASHLRTRKSLEMIKTINAAGLATTHTHMFSKYIFSIVKYLIKCCQIILLHIYNLYNGINMPN